MGCVHIRTIKFIYICVWGGGLSMMMPFFALVVRRLLKVGNHWLWGHLGTLSNTLPSLDFMQLILMQELPLALPPVFPQ